MISVNSPFMQKEIIALLENLENPSYTYIKKQGIQLYFETTSSNDDEAAAHQKKCSKNNRLLKALLLMFSLIKISVTQKKAYSQLILSCL